MVKVDSRVCYQIDLLELRPLFKSGFRFIPTFETPTSFLIVRGSANNEFGVSVLG